MTSLAAKLLQEALLLPEEERGDLAAKLIESLDSDADEDVDAAWSAEIHRRLEDLRTGQVQPIPWPEARRMIMGDSDDADSA